MSPVKAQQFFDHCKSVSSAFLEDKADSAKKPLSSVISIDKFFTYGSCVPFLSQSIGATRVLYGTMIIGYALCELVNKFALAKLNQDATFYDKVALLKGGIVPALIKGVEHVSLGFAAQSSFIWALATVGYEHIIRPYLPKSIVEETTVDSECFQKLFARTRKHSLWKEADSKIAELKKLALNG